MAAFQRERGLRVTGKLDDETWAKLLETSVDSAVKDYTLTKDDLKSLIIGPCRRKWRD